MVLYLIKGFAYNSCVTDLKWINDDIFTQYKDLGGRIEGFRLVIKKQVK